jgi:hypothetical protein
MGFEIFIYILRWVTKLIGKICDLPPAHPSSYFMTSPLVLQNLHGAKSRNVWPYPYRILYICRMSEKELKVVATRNKNERCQRKTSKLQEKAKLRSLQKD